MKVFLSTCSLLLVLFSQSSFAQIFDRSLRFGFVAEPQVVRAMDEGKWLVVGKGVPYSGALFSDTVFAVIFDQQAEVLLRETLSFPMGEMYHVRDAVVLSDSAFIISVGSGSCDVGGDFEVLVQKYSSDGQLIWTLQGSNENADKPPVEWKITPDGNLLGLTDNIIWKVDANTGSILWQAELITMNGQQQPFSFDLLPGTEDFIGIGVPDFQIWKKVENPNQRTYVLQNSLVLNQPWKGLGFAQNGWYYVLNRSNDDIGRVDQSLNYEVMITSNDFEGLLQMAAVDDGLYFLGREYSQNWLRKTDFLGQNPIELPMPDRWLKGYSLAARGDSVAVAGVDGSGPKSIPGDPSAYPQFQAQHLWLRTFSGLTPTTSADTMNAAVTDLQQLTGVDTVSHLGNAWGYTFTLHGGDFQVQITNSGNTLLDQVYVNFSYEQNRNFICFNTPAEQRLYTNLDLPPGESTWVDFGDLGSQEQSGLASEFCFWTSAPNGRPDAHHEDDHFCLSATYTVPTTTPASLPIKLLPNPVQDFFRVLNAADAEDAIWQLHDATSRLMQRGIYPAGQSELNISTAQLPNGFYIFKMNNYIGKLIIKH